jgi:hypothetical protein
VLVAAVVMLAALEIAGLRGSLEAQMRVQRHEIARMRGALLRGVPMVLTGEDRVETSWTSGGVVHRVTTAHEAGESEAGESVAAWRDRHFAAVVAAQAEFPPDTGE